MNDVQMIPISSFAKVIGGYAFKSNDFVSEGIPVIKIKNIGDKKLTFEDTDFLSDEFMDISDKYKIKYGDVLISLTGSHITQPNSAVGRVARSYSKQVFLLNQRVGKMEVYPDKCDLGFLYYYMVSDSFRGQIGLRSRGAANQANISGGDIENITIPNFSLPIQKKIAAILSAYDDLIENNLKQIRLLEEMAQITYQEWFVRLKFPNHENTPIDEITGLPIGWKEINIGKLVDYEIGGGWGEDELSKDFSEPAYVIRGTDIDELSLGGKIDNVPFRYHKPSNLKSRKLQKLDIVFEVSGGSQTEGVAKTILITEELLKRFNNNVMCASFCKLVRLENENNAYFVLHYLRFLRTIKATEVFEIKGASSIINYNWTGFLKFQKIILPNFEIMELFNNKVTSIHREINTLGSQNQLLKEAHDILLPRLMTGKITVGADLSA